MKYLITLVCLVCGLAGLVLTLDQSPAPQRSTEISLFPANPLPSLCSAWDRTAVRPSALVPLVLEEPESAPVFSEGALSQEQQVAEAVYGPQAETATVVTVPEEPTVMDAPLLLAVVDKADPPGGAPDRDSWPDQIACLPDTDGRRVVAEALQNAEVFWT